MPDLSHMLPADAARGYGRPVDGGVPMPTVDAFRQPLVRASDADHLGFLQSQVAQVETTPWRRLYATIQYPTLVPVDRSAWEWAASIERYTMDGFGRAAPMGQRATDMPLVNTTRDRLTQKIEDYWIGYDYSTAELEQARRVPMFNFLGEKAQLANRLMDEEIDRIVLEGRSDVGWDGLIANSPTGVTHVDAANNHAGNSRLWTNKTGLEMAKDVNDAVGGIWTNSETIIQADTVLLPPQAFDIASRTPISSDFPNETVIEWVRRNNLYTAETGQNLLIRVCRGLEDAASGSNNGALLAYRRHPDFLRLHMPMSFRLAAAQMSGPYRYIVPGMMRCGGLEIRIPASLRFVDGITS